MITASSSSSSDRGPRNADTAARSAAVEEKRPGGRFRCRVVVSSTTRRRTTRIENRRRTYRGEYEIVFDILPKCRSRRVFRFYSRSLQSRRIHSRPSGFGVPRPWPSDCRHAYKLVPGRTPRRENTMDAITVKLKKMLLSRNVVLQVLNGRSVVYGGTDVDVLELETYLGSSVCIIISFKDLIYLIGKKFPR